MKRCIICLLIAITALTTSCAYYPHLTGTPLIKEKGDTRIEGGLTLYSPSAQASFSRGLTEKLAFQVAASIGYDDYYTQGALGYFKNINNKTVMELYGGVGFGHGDAYKDANPGHLRGNYQIYFAQFNIGNIEKKLANLEYGIGLKPGYLHSKMTDANYFFISENYSKTDSYPVYSLNGFIFEPTVFLRFGGKNLKFNIALGKCWMVQLTHTDKTFPVGSNFGIGVSYSFGGTSKKYPKAMR